jgi:hypothetical protein
VEPLILGQEEFLTGALVLLGKVMPEVQEHSGVVFRAEEEVVVPVQQEQMELQSRPVLEEMVELVLQV